MFQQFNCSVIVDYRERQLETRNIKKIYICFFPQSCLITKLCQHLIDFLIGTNELAKLLRKIGTFEVGA